MLRQIIKKILHLTPRIFLNHKCNIERHGSEYGGWVICPDYISKRSIIYSLGIGEDISFDLSLIEKYNCNVFGFDPTPKSIKWINNQILPENFFFINVGLSNTDSLVKFFPPQNKNYVSYSMFNKKGKNHHINSIELEVKRLKTLMDMLGHNTVDLLKMDIEGSEYDVIEDMIASDIFPKQLQIEFHFRRNYKLIRKTEKLLNETLYGLGYRTFYVSPSYHEVSLILWD